LEGHESHNHENSLVRKAEVRSAASMRVPEENTRDDSLFYEQQVPSAKIHNENNYFHHGEARGLNLKENDDSSLEKHRKSNQVKNVKEDDGAMSAYGNGNDDNSFEHHGSSVYHHTNGHVTADDVMEDESSVAKSNAHDDSVATEEENMAEAALLASIFNGRGNDVNDSLVDRVDIFSKRAPSRFSCAYCCKLIR